MSATSSLNSTATIAAPDCPVCGDTGWLSPGPTLGAGPARLIACACGLAEKRRQAAKLDAAQQHLAELRAALGRLARCTFDTFDLSRPLSAFEWNGKRVPVEAQQKALHAAFDMARAYADSPAGWLYLYGPAGSGKSHLAAAVANALGYSIPAAYASAPELLAYVKRGFGDGTQSGRFDSLLAVDLLILDDLGTEQETPWSTETLFRLIDERAKRDDRSTVITSNNHHDALPFRVASRIAGMARTALVVASDYRRLPL